MSAPILATKLYIPPPRPGLVHRPRLLERLNAGLRQGPSFSRKLTLISAAAGFGKTTLLSAWIADCKLRKADSESRADAQAPRPQPSPIGTLQFAWLSLDEADSDPAQFLTYLVAALQTLAPGLGAGVLAALQAPQPPPAEALLTVLLNEIAAFPDSFSLILDDYHLIDAQAVDQALAFLIEHLPPQMHLVIATREDPSLPLARLRARGQLAELRAADLRFTPAEAADFLNQAMGLALSAGDMAALEARTEGWIAGLQLAALALQGASAAPGRADTAGFIQSFTGSHRFVLDYLLTEVLQQQAEGIQTFLLRTALLDRMCGPLCDAVLAQGAGGQATLEYLEHANLFIVPLDNERRWYRYHHLFGDLLRQRLGQQLPARPVSGAADEVSLATLHTRAGQWYEDHGLPLEAFRHAAAADDIDRAERLIGHKGMPLHLHSVAMTVLDWLASLPQTVRDARPQLWVRSATVALMGGQTTGVEDWLQAAEKALQNFERDEKTRDLIGQIACARATLALTRYDPEAMIAQARRALDYLPPQDLVFRFTANWALAAAALLQGDRAAATRACLEGIAISQKSGDIFSMVLATSDLGQAQALDNQLHQAADTFQRVLQLAGDYPHPNVGEVQLGLARIAYEWNDLEAAEQHGQQSLQLARLYDRVIDRFIISEVFLARLKLARGEVDGAAALLAQAEQAARQQNFLLRLPEIAAAQVLVGLRQGQLATAAQLAQHYDLPSSLARVRLAQRDPAAALAILGAWRQQVEAKGWADERLQALVLQALALHQSGAKDQAAQRLGETLALAEPGGFIRLFVDEGEPMRRLLADFKLKLEEQAHDTVHPLLGYVNKLLAAFPRPVEANAQPQVANQISEMVEPLSERELEVLQHLIAGLTNQEIADRLYLSLNTVKVHARNIYGKLGVNTRTQAAAKARELGLLPRA